MSTKPTGTRLMNFPPEIHLSVLSYLGPGDLFSLLLTCKALSWIAHQQLYARLHFGVSREVLEKKGLALPRGGEADDFDFRIPPEKFEKLLATPRNRRGAILAAFQRTKKLVVHEFLYNYPSQRRVEGLIRHLCSFLGKLIDQGKMPALKEVFLETYDYRDSDMDPLIKAFMRMFESELNSRLSLGLKLKFSSFTREKRTNLSFLTFPADPYILTSLDIQSRLRNSWHGMDQSEAEARGLAGELGNAGAEIQHLLNVLSRTPRLRFLRLEHVLKNPASVRQYEIFEMWKLTGELSKLQRVILELNSLETLSLAGVIFHHSWFVIPPRNVRTLSVIGPLSDVWYKEFAKHPLTRVEDLTIEYADEDCGCWETSDGWELDLGEVAVCGLKSLRFKGYDGPEGWVDGMIKKNNGLEVVRGDVDKQKMETAGWVFHRKGEDGYWLRLRGAILVPDESYIDSLAEDT